MMEDEQEAWVPAVFPRQQEPWALAQGPGAERGCPSFSDPLLGGGTEPSAGSQGTQENPLQFTNTHSKT